MANNVTSTEDAKQRFIDDEIILSNCDDPTEGVENHLFADDDEHFYHGKFYDGIAVLYKDPEDEGVPEKLVMTYPTMDVVSSNADIAYEIIDYVGLGTEDNISYFDIALKYGKSYRPEDIELPF